MISKSSHLHPVRRAIARALVWLSFAAILAFFYFLITDFGGFAWTVCFLGAIAGIIIANVISHPFIPPQRQAENESPLQVSQDTHVLG